MIGLSHVQAFCASAAMLSSAEALKDLLADMTRRMGFTYFALVHHIELTNAGHRINLVDAVCAHTRGSGDAGFRGVMWRMDVVGLVEMLAQDKSQDKYGKQRQAFRVFHDLKILMVY